MTTTYFQSASLNMVAWLLTKGIAVKSTNKYEGQTIFYFDRTDDLQKAVNEYNNNIELKKFIANFKKAKELTRV